MRLVSATIDLPRSPNTATVFSRMRNAKKGEMLLASGGGGKLYLKFAYRRQKEAIRASARLPLGASTSPECVVPAGPLIRFWHDTFGCHSGRRRHPNVSCQPGTGRGTRREACWQAVFRDEEAH